MNHSEPTLSQAAVSFVSAEGAETSEMSLNNNSRLERPRSIENQSRSIDHEIVQSPSKDGSDESLGYSHSYHWRSHAGASAEHSSVRKCQRGITGPHQSSGGRPVGFGSFGPSDEQSSDANCVNCGNPLTVMPRATRSQAVEESTEGSTTRVWSPERTVKPHERAASSMDDEIVWASRRLEEVLGKLQNVNNSADLRDFGSTRLALFRWNQRQSQLSPGFEPALLHTNPGWNCRPADEQSSDENRVNCGNTLTIRSRAIRSQASQQCVEGSETRSWSPTGTVKILERAASLADDEIVHAVERSMDDEVGQTSVCRPLLVLPSRRRRVERRCGCRPRVQQWRSRPVGDHASRTPDHPACSPELQRERGILQRWNHVGSRRAQHWSTGRSEGHYVRSRRTSDPRRSVDATHRIAGVLSGTSAFHPFSSIPA